jgi:hypothetical protein
MRKETLMQKKARLSKSSKYKTVLANLREIKSVKQLITTKLNTLSSYINEVIKEEKRQARLKRAIEIGDEVTMEVVDIDGGGDEGDLDEGFDDGDMDNMDDESFDEGGAEEVVEMEKEMRKIQRTINRIKSQGKRKAVRRK